MEFDQYAQDYNIVLNRGLSLSGETVDYFAQKRVEYIHNYIQRLGLDIRSIVEFGCGIGNNLVFLRRYFPDSQILGLDVSDESIRKANERFADDGNTQIQNLSEFQATHCADLVFINGVFHHIPAEDHAKNLELIRSILKENALLALFENNYFNPATRWIMNRVAFDKDAVLINPYRLLNQVCRMHFSNARLRFYFIFPKIFNYLRFLESYCEEFPLGAQYCIFAKKS